MARIKDKERLEGRIMTSGDGWLLRLITSKRTEIAQRYWKGITSLDAMAAACEKLDRVVERIIWETS